jgi:hypothetical protein
LDLGLQLQDFGWTLPRLRGKGVAVTAAGVSKKAPRTPKRVMDQRV